MEQKINQKVIDEARRLLTASIEELSRTELIDLCISLESLREPILRLRCQAQRELAEAREKMRTPPHDPKARDEPRLTDFDRQTMLNASVAELAEAYEYLKGLEELIESKVNLLKMLVEVSDGN